MKNIPLYRRSREHATQNGELELWQASYDANKACAQAIMQETTDSYDGEHLDEGTARRVIDRFGYDRVNWALQTTMERLHSDVRYSVTHREWAREAFTHYVQKEMRDYRVEARPEALNDFITQARQAWQELNLYDHTHCAENSRQQDYHGKVLVLSPLALADQYKRPDDQLFLCSGGFGASAGARGRKVIGQFLADGEQCQFERYDFIGIIKDEHLPEWALEKLEHFHEPEQRPEMELH